MTPDPELTDQRMREIGRRAVERLGPLGARDAVMERVVATFQRFNDRLEAALDKDDPEAAARASETAVAVEYRLGVVLNEINRHQVH